MINDRHSQPSCVTYRLLERRLQGGPEGAGLFGFGSVLLERTTHEPDRTIVDTLHAWPDADLGYDDFAAVSAMLQRCLYVVRKRTVLYDADHMPGLDGWTQS